MVAKVKAATEITATAIYKYIDPATGKQCYAVPSDSEPGKFHKTCWNEETSCWECTCKNGTVAAQYGRGAHCKHARAAQVSVLANLAQEREARLSREAYNDEFSPCTIVGMY